MTRFREGAKLNVRLINAVAWLLLIVAVLGFLHIGRDLLIPFVIAIFIWYLLNVLTLTYGSWTIAGTRLPHWLARLASAMTLLLLAWQVVNLVTRNVFRVVDAAPGYQENLLRQFRAALRMIGIEDSQIVTQYFADLGLGEMIALMAKGTANLLGHFGLICIYLLFLFVEQRFFMRKMERVLKGAGRHRNLLRVLQNIDEDIRTYIGVKTFTSFLTGTLSYLIMRWVGLDYADFWGFLIFVFNFIPTIGSIVATILPSLLALVQFDSLSPFVMILCGITAIQVVIGNILDPGLVGQRLNISPLAIILSLMLWGYLWGVPGMFLGVPIMVTLMIVLYHFEDTRWVALMLSRDGRPTISATGSDAPAGSDVPDDRG